MSDRQDMTYEEWQANTRGFYGAPIGNTAIFEQAEKERKALQNRASWATPTSLDYGKFQAQTLELVDRSYAPVVVLGYLSYSLTRSSAKSFYLPADENGQAIIAAGSKVIMIYSFYSNYEHQFKGIGSRLLRGLIELAEKHDCDHVVVVSSINDPVYESLGFKILGQMFCYISLARLKQRLARGMLPLPTFKKASAEAPF